MSIDLHDINNPSDLIDYMGLKHFHPYNKNKFSAGEFFTSIWECCNAIWEHQQHEHFTIHDLKHSINIIHYFTIFDKKYSFSEYEKLVFITAAFIHDIGMQYNVWNEHIDLEDFEKLTLDEIRKNHTILGFEYVEKFISLDGKMNSNFPPPLCSPDTEKLTILEEAKNIAFAHSGDKYLRMFYDSRWNSQDRAKPSMKFRPRLLAGLLRICDELDGNVLRVPRIEKVWEQKLDDISRYHWFANYFVDNNLLVIDDDGLGEVKMLWASPKSFNDEQDEKLFSLLEILRKVKLQSDISKVNNFFDECNERNLQMNIKVTLPEKPFKKPYASSDDLDSLLDKSLKHFGSDDSTSISKKNFSSKKKLNENLVRLEDKLKKWFKTHARRGHFELMSGDHTSVFLSCRTLVSDQELLKQISHVVYDKFRQSNITTIIAVGTSAIPLSISCSFLFKSSVTFTVSSTKDFIHNDKSNIYEENELSPLLKNNKSDGSILIIDDVIATGKVADEMVSSLNKSNIKYDNLYHFSIFRLGSKEYDLDDRVKKLYYIVHKTDVEYYLPGEECRMCKDGTDLEKEVNIS